VRYDELTKMIIDSSPHDWELLGDGPLYLDRLGEVTGDGQHWVEVDSHHYLAVYKPDISLRLAWGLKLEGQLSFEGWTWPDPSISRHAVDAFWQGALVARWTILIVDGARSYLPDPERAYVKTDDTSRGYETVGWTAKASEITIARLLDGIVRPSGEFDRYFGSAGIVEVPDE
jgi:hypothetical protein